MPEIMVACTLCQERVACTPQVITSNDGVRQSRLAHVQPGPLPFQKGGPWCNGCR